MLLSPVLLVVNDWGFVLSSTAVSTSPIGRSDDECGLLLDDGYDVDCWDDAIVGVGGGETSSCVIILCSSAAAC